jgi:hypothetical protein
VLFPITNGVSVMVLPLQELLGNMYCLDGAPLFWICTAWLVTLPVAAATGFDEL